MEPTAIRETDPYPSRRGEPSRLIERQDPILHGPATGALSWHQRKSYEADGFLCLEHFLDPEELREIQEEAGRLRSHPEINERPETVREPDSNLVRSVFAVHRLSRIMDRVTRHPRLLATARELLGGDVYLTQTRINYKPGFSGKDFFWHSDFETWHVEDGMPRMRAVSCSLSLTPNFELNGPLLIIPGSHQYYVSCSGTTPEEHYRTSLRRQEHGVPDAERLRELVDMSTVVSPKGPEGQATFFECNVMHGSNSNIAPWPRTNLFIVYNSVENRLGEPYCGLRPRPDHVANRTELEPLRPREE